ncbi:hypothetical protein [Caulobacter sp. S45]|jgi:hypothetical protein|uniref:hypothetical protein n=1 Tax=Caulobacter sp. S45 TaxID=1641861 RepID=UPI00131B63D3|nr:hypothetical protein [Caulobacter sp. S45]
MSKAAAGPMAEMEGVVTVVQEGRFQLTDLGGVSHNFMLSRFALAETEQLPALQNAQSRVRVKYSQADKLIAYLAHRIDLLDVA